MVSTIIEEFYAQVGERLDLVGLKRRTNAPYKLYFNAFVCGLLSIAHAYGHLE